MKNVLGLIIVTLLNFSKCAEILVVLPSSGYSQYILAEPLIKELANKGHNLTVISAFETKNVNKLTNIVCAVKEEKVRPDLLHLHAASSIETIDNLNKRGVFLTERLLQNDEVQKLIISNRTFDLAIVETFVSEALLVFAKHFNAHLVLFHSMGVSEWNSHLVGNPHLPSYLPITFSGYTTYMNFPARFRNSLALWFDRLYKHFVQYPAQQKLVDKYFPKKYDLMETMYNVSLMLTCSHVSTAEPQPLTTSIVEVGGIHIVEEKLTEDLEKLLNSSEFGAVFFSLGSNALSSDLKPQRINDIVNTFRKLNQNVLWKFETDSIEDIMPKNLFISKWYPQTSILAHPNTILFISHCGMGSTTEIIYYGIPAICIPLFGDQFNNAARLVQFGVAIELPFKELNEQTLYDSIKEILNNSSYANNAMKRSNIMRDRPMPPLELAIYWIEYVLRHNGADHLRNSIVQLEWYKLYLVDVILTIVLGVLAIIYINYLICRKLKRTLLSIKKKTE